MTQREVRHDSRYAPSAAPATVSIARLLRVGDRAWLGENKVGWKVRARNDRFVILTQPFNFQRTVQYTVIDLELGIRGTDDYHGLGYETDEQCARALGFFEEEHGAEISVRNNVVLDIERVAAAAKDPA